MTPINNIIHRGPISRRNALKMAGGCAALTNTSLLSTMFNLSATNAVVAQSGDLTDYKALVCVFLFGGNDSTNMLSPMSGSDTTGERKNYLDARGGVYDAQNNPAGLGLTYNDLHQITDSASGRSFGVHPGAAEMKTLYDAGKLSFLCNVGSLIEPTTIADYQAGLNLPLGLFSHADLQRHWMTSVPQTRSQVTGWAGRMADLVVGATNSNQNISMNISLNNVNMLQTGSSVVPYIIGDNGAREVSWYSPTGGTWTAPKIFSQLTDDVLSRSYGNLLERTFAKMNRNSLDAAIEFNVAVNAELPNVETYFPTGGGSRLQKQLRMVAQSIAARNTIGQNRQIFFIGMGGYDNHDELINNQNDNMIELSQALKSFQDTMDGLGLTDDVLTFSASDFSRTLNSNGKGSDHAWGGNSLVMGGPVAGGQIHGDYPTDLAPGNPIDLGRGRLLPTTSVDEMAAEIAMWYGIDNDNNLETVLPNIRNFPSANTGAHPIGFLS